MAEFFSAYVGSRQAVGPRLLRAAPLLPAVLVCLFLLQAVPFVYATAVVLAGGIVWGISMAGVFLRPNRVALSFAIFGAMLVGTGVLSYGFGRDCWCEDSRDPVVRFLRTVTGHPQSSQVSIVCY